MERILRELAANQNEDNALQLLRVLVSQLRPRLIQTIYKAEANLRILISYIEKEPELRDGLKRNLLFVIHNADIFSLFTQSGMITRGSFFGELQHKFSNKILPPLQEESSIEYKFSRIFNGTKDYHWMLQVDNTLWIGLFEALQFRLHTIPVQVKAQLLNAVKVLSYKLAAIGLEREITRQIPDHGAFFSPFMMQSRELEKLCDMVQTGAGEDDIDKAASSIYYLLNQCEDNIDSIKNTTDKNGSSLHQTFLIRRTEQMIGRIRALIDILDVKTFNVKWLVGLMKTITTQELNKTRLFGFISENLTFIAYQIAEHKSKSGEHYIANNRKEYKKMFYSACGAGVIISFVVMFKVMIHHMGLAPFWEAVMTSLNYAMGFIMIHITGSTLATKQPAMTASTLARFLDLKASGRPAYDKMALMFSKVWSSQTISFIGNLLVVLPLTATLVIIADTFLAQPFVPEAEAQNMLNANNPTRSLAWFYAGITGFFLFFSGIISGYYDNKVIYDKIPLRLKNHPRLQKMMPKEWLEKLGNYLDHNLGSLIGNFMLGFFLGTATFIGNILGFPYDIRHITISSGYFSIGVWELLNTVPWHEILWVFIGVLGVGFVNFMVSFSLAFYVALKSRNVRSTDVLEFLKAIAIHFDTNPKDFLIPSENDNAKVETEKGVLQHKE